MPLLEWLAEKYKDFGKRFFNAAVVVLATVKRKAVFSLVRQQLADPSFLWWFVYFSFLLGATLEFVTNRSQEGSQFVKGFGGIGGVLRYKLDFDAIGYDSDEFFSDWHDSEDNAASLQEGKKLGAERRSV